MIIVLIIVITFCALCGYLAEECGGLEGWRLHLQMWPPILGWLTFSAALVVVGVLA